MVFLKRLLLFTMKEESLTVLSASIDARYANDVILVAADAMAVATAAGKRVYEKWWKEQQHRGGGENFVFEEDETLFDRDKVIHDSRRLVGLMVNIGQRRVTIG